MRPTLPGSLLQCKLSFTLQSLENYQDVARTVRIGQLSSQCWDAACSVGAIARTRLASMKVRFQ